MELKAGFLFLVIVIPASVGFQWTSFSQIPDGSSIRACVGERGSFPWSFSLTTEEHVISVEWYKTTGKGEVLVAALVAGHFLPNAGQNVTFVPDAGLQVGHVNLADFGTFSVRVNYNNNGLLHASRQTVFLTMEDSPVLVDGHLVANVRPEPVLDDFTGLRHVQLTCGNFLSLGSRPVSVVWKTPSDYTVASTFYINGTFRLNLPHPTQGGRYYCLLKDPSVAARCIPNVSRLMRGNYIHVDEVQIRLTLLEGGLQGLQSRDEKLDREMARQADLDSELLSREQNLTAEVGRLAEITDMLLKRTEKLTSDNEKLKTQTEKLTSDNEKQKTQTEKLTSDNEKLKNQTEKLTSDNDRLKSQMQSTASQLTEGTARLSSRVDNMATNTDDLSKQLLALKSRSDVTYLDDNRILVFRVTAGVGERAYEKYKSVGVNDDLYSALKSCGCKTVNGSCNTHYRSGILDKWPSALIDTVRVSVYKQGEEVAFVEFNGRRSAYTNWFSQSRVAASSWTDLKTEPYNHFSIEGDGSIRRFFINRNYGGCPKDRSWLVVSDTNDLCTWGQGDSHPIILYSKLSGYGNPNDAGQFGRADVLTVTIKLRDDVGTTC